MENSPVNSGHCQVRATPQQKTLLLFTEESHLLGEKECVCFSVEISEAVTGTLATPRPSLSPQQWAPLPQSPGPLVW